MAMPLPAAIRAQGPYYTVDILDQLPDDGNRYEVVYGELLVTPAPRWTHQELVARLFLRIHRYLERFSLGHLVMSPADVRWGRDPGVQPGRFVAPKAVARTMDWRQIRELLLVIEVLSPSSRRADRFTKRRRDQEAGVPLYWIVDGANQAVDVWTAEATFPPRGPFGAWLARRIRLVVRPVHVPGVEPLRQQCRLLLPALAVDAFTGCASPVTHRTQPARAQCRRP